MGKLPDVRQNKRYAFAKVNLGLSVLGRRADGYHELSTVMSGVMLRDTICLKETESGLLVVCPGFSDIPQEENLVYKAANMYMGDMRVRPGFHITVHKGIPIGAGMGGGSSDAAATLLLLQQFFFGTPQNAHVHQIAAKLGADVPFFLGCDETPPSWEAALCTGIGESITPVNTGYFWVVIVFMQKGVSTPRAFLAWDEMNGFKPFHGIRPGYDFRSANVAKALEMGDPAALSCAIYNDLEPAVTAFRPDIGESKQILIQCGALNAAMTGTGSAVFGVCLNKSHADEVRQRMVDVLNGTPLGLQISAIEVIRTGVQG